MAYEEGPLVDTWGLHGNKELVLRYEILERIGEGTFGEVFKARRREDDLIVALKEIHNSESSCREVKALLLLDHPNVVKLHEYFFQGSNVVLVLEYLPYNLSDVIRGAKGELSEGEVKGLIFQILQGLAACHAVSVLHRDLKPTNLLIARDGTLKIADFGQARVLPEESSLNEEEFDGSEAHENRSGGIRSLDFREIDTTNASVAGGEDTSVEWPECNRCKAEVPFDYFCVEASGRAGNGNGLKTEVQEDVSESKGIKAPECRMKISEDLESGDEHSASGQSSMASAVNDARTYFTVEEMVSTGADGLGMSGLHRKPIIESNAQDLGCCAWFTLQNAENDKIMNKLKRLSPERYNTAMEDTLVLDGDYFVQHEDGFGSDESDVDWKGQYGISSEDLIETKKTQEIQDAEVPSGASKVEGDFVLLQKLRQFLRKRTKGLSKETVMTDPVPNRNEWNFRGGYKVSNSTPSHGHTSHVESPGSGANTWSRDTSKLSFIVESPASPVVSVISRGPREDEDMFSSQQQDIFNEPNVGHQSMHDCARSLNDGSTSGVCQGPFISEGQDAFESVNDTRVVEVTDEVLVQQSILTRQTTGDFAEVGGHESQVVRCEGSDIYDQSSKMLHAGEQEAKEAKVERKPTRPVSNGPLREMAYASFHEDGMTVHEHNGGFRDELPVQKAGLTEVGMNSDEHIASTHVEKSEADPMDPITQDGEQGKANDLVFCDGNKLESAGASDVEVLGAKQGVLFSSRGASNYPTSIGIPREERCEISFHGIPDRDDGRSWEQMEGNSSALSDAEGTRWYGTPEFQYSYMEQRDADTADGRVSGGMFGLAARDGEEWEDDSRQVASHESGRFSQDSTDRGDTASEGGSDFTTMIGTRWYKAPELLYGATKYGKGVDIWAVGCILGELLWGKPLFPGINDIDQLSRLVKVLGSPSEKNWRGVSLLPDFDKINFGDALPLTLENYLPDVSEASLQFLERLLTYDPLLRPSAEEALVDGIFSKNPLPCPCREMDLQAMERGEPSDDEWGEWKDPGSPFSDFEILG